MAFVLPPPRPQQNTIGDQLAQALTAMVAAKHEREFRDYQKEKMKFDLAHLAHQERQDKQAETDAEFKKQQDSALIALQHLTGRPARQAIPGIEGLGGQEILPHDLGGNALPSGPQPGPDISIPMYGGPPIQVHASTLEEILSQQAKKQAMVDAEKLKQVEAEAMARRRAETSIPNPPGVNDTPKPITKVEAVRMGVPELEGQTMTTNDLKAAAEIKQKNIDNRRAEARDAAMLKALADKSGAAVVKVEYKDPLDGKKKIEWIPKGQLVNRKFDAPDSATAETRLNSSEAVIQTGNDIIESLKSPDFKKEVGPILGRFNSLRDFIGNPPPEFQTLAGNIESFALANMGVHGMRSVQGAKLISKMLDQKHTPESLIASINGLNNFAEHLMANAGRKVPGVSTAPASKKDPKDMTAEELVAYYASKK